MLKRITIILLGFIAGVLGNLIAAYVQQDVWSNVFTLDRLLVTAGSVVLMLLLVASLETERGIGAGIASGICGSCSRIPSFDIGNLTSRAWRWCKANAQESRVQRCWQKAFAKI